MSVNLLALASELADENPFAAQLIVDIMNAETSVEINDALEVYDASFAN